MRQVVRTAGWAKGNAQVVNLRAQVGTWGFDPKNTSLQRCVWVLGPDAGPEQGLKLPRVDNPCYEIFLDFVSNSPRLGNLQYVHGHFRQWSTKPAFTGFIMT